MTSLTRILPLLYLICLMIPAYAQSQDEFGIPITLNSQRRGEISDDKWRTVYQFSGGAGELVKVQLKAISGDLDPVLAIFDEGGNLLFRRDDTQGSRNVEAVIALPDSTQYTAIVGRFGDSYGLTTGEYEFVLEQAGSVTAPSELLTYGNAVIGSISNSNPQHYYVFEAQEGDILNVSMTRNSGNLDPLVQIVTKEAMLLAENDDETPQTTNAVIRNLVIPQTDAYVAIASRYNQSAGDSTGGYVLSIEESDQSGLGNSLLAPRYIQFGETVSGTISNDQVRQYYAFDAQRDDVIRVIMDRTDGLLDSYLEILDASGQVLFEDDDGGVGQNSRIEQFRITADGRYIVVATRLDEGEGTTEGEYSVSLELIARAFQGLEGNIEVLEYGTVATGTISEDTSELLFSFWGEQDDIVQIAMTRTGGNLDSWLELLDADRTRLSTDDDSAGEQNALIAPYQLPASGIYYIRATRYTGTTSDPNTTGEFTLELTRVE